MKFRLLILFGSRPEFCDGISCLTGCICSLFRISSRFDIKGKSAPDKINMMLPFCQSKKDFFIGRGGNSALQSRVAMRSKSITQRVRRPVSKGEYRKNISRPFFIFIFLFKEINDSSKVNISNCADSVLIFSTLCLRESNKAARLRNYLKYSSRFHRLRTFWIQELHRK